MSAFMSRVTKFAKSPQGRRVFAEAQKVAKDPATRRKIADARNRLGKRGGGGA